jgi:hypothetical protein
LADGFRHARLGSVATNVLPAGSLQDTPPIASAPKRVTGQVEVAIVGGGIVGLSAALSKAQRDVSVALFEKGRQGRLGGEVLVDAATGRDPDVDVAPFRLSRFFAGPRLSAGAEILRPSMPPFSLARDRRPEPDAPCVGWPHA